MNEMYLELLVAVGLVIAWAAFPTVMSLTLATLNDSGASPAVQQIVRFVPALYIIGISIPAAAWLGRDMED